jgi:photosystem II stability/assembly factor-like uncharacterized protein
LLKKYLRLFLTLFAAASLISPGPTHAGYQWQTMPYGSEDISFRGIAAVDDLTCWVSGSGGTIIRTTDGGKNWQDVSIPGTDSLDFRDIEVLDDGTAIAMSIGPGAQSRIYRTEDEGTNWTMVKQNKYEEGFYDAIAFWDNGYGIMQGDPIDGKLFILITKDNGKSWQEISREQMPAAKEGEYAFAASGTQLITTPDGNAWIGTGGADARILHSNDFGKTWASVPTPIIKGEESTGVFSLAFGDDSVAVAVAVGGDYTTEGEGTDNIGVSDDGGESWGLISGETPDFRSAVKYTDGMFIAVGPSGSDYSMDNGKSWKAIEGPGFHTMDIGEGGIDAVWAAGRGGIIGKLQKN